MRRWVRGSAIPVTVPIRNNDATAVADIGDLVDVDSVSVSVWDRAGTQKVEDQAAANLETGYYRYFIVTASGWILGTYDVEVTVTSASQPRIIKSSFVLVSSRG